MGAYKTNIYKLRFKLYNNHKPVIVSFNIEHIMLIANIIN